MAGAVAYSSPIHSSLFSPLAVVLTLLGLLGAATFIVYELGAKKKKIVHELLIAGGASTFLGFGTFFIVLSAGLYV
jgi:hypothetical protein